MERPAATRLSGSGWLDAPDRELARAEVLLAEVANLPEHDEVVCSAWAGRASRRRCFRRAFDAAASTSSTRRIRRRSAAGGPARPRAHAVRRLLEVGLDRRDARPLRVLLRRVRARRRPLRRRSPTRGRRSSGCRRARARRGTARRARDRGPLLGAVAVRNRSSRADGRGPRAPAHPRARVREACRLPDRATPGSSSVPRSATTGARAATRSCRAERVRLRASGPSSCWPSRRGRTAGTCPRTGGSARGGRANRRGPPLTPTSWGRRCSAGSSRPPSPATSSGSTRSTSRTCRRRRTARPRCWGSDEPLEPEGSGRRAARRGTPAHYVAIQAFVDPSASRTAGGSCVPETPAVSSRTVSARATCTRPASSTRAGRRASSACRSSTTRARELPDSRQALRVRPADPRAGRR